MLREPPSLTNTLIKKQNIEEFIGYVGHWLDTSRVPLRYRMVPETLPKTWCSISKVKIQMKTLTKKIEFNQHLECQKYHQLKNWSGHKVYIPKELR